MQNGQQLHVLSTVWVDETPSVRVRVDGGDSTVIPLAALTLRYSLEGSARRRCIGHKPFRDRAVSWIDCNSPPLPQSLTCDRCAANDAAFAAQLHHAHQRGRGELDSAVLAHLDKPNSLYLAAFRDGSIKVGTSTKPRLQTRLAEQGAWRAVIAANATDGFAVRTLEDRVTAEIGLPQSVAIGRKLAGLEQPKTDEWLESELSRWQAAVAGLIERLADPRLSSANTLWVTPCDDDSRWKSVHRYPRRLDSGSHDLEVLGASGRAVLARRPSGIDHFAADLRQLYGILIDTSDDVTPDELTVQDSLF